MTEFEHVAFDVFRDHFGFKVTKIQEGAEKEADFEVSDGNNLYLVEMKTRNRSMKDLLKSGECDEAGGVSVFTTQIRRQGNVTKIVSSAVEQMESSADDLGCLRIILYFVSGIGSHERWENFLTSIYGSKNVVDWAEGGAAKQCYYFGNSDFYRYRNRLDGAVLLNDFGKGVFCLNDHSPNADRLRRSRLVEKFGPAVIDPPILEENGKAWVANGAIDRSDEIAVLNHVKCKYSLSELTNVIEMGFASASKLVPLPKEGG